MRHYYTSKVSFQIENRANFLLNSPLTAKIEIIVFLGNSYYEKKELESEIKALKSTIQALNSQLRCQYDENSERIDEEEESEQSEIVLHVTKENKRQQKEKRKEEIQSENDKVDQILLMDEQQ